MVSSKMPQNFMDNSLVCIAVNKAATGVDNMELIHFEIQFEPMSIHQPLARLLAGGY